MLQQSVTSSGPDEPAAILVGSLMFVIPRASTTLEPADYADLACALVAEEEGRSDLVGALIAGLERRLGVNPAHREAAILGSAEVRRRISADQRKRKLYEAQRARRLGAQTVAPRMTEIVEDTLRRVDEHLAKVKALREADPRKNREAINAHMTEVKRLRKEAEALRQKDEDDRWRHAAIEETRNLALARGEDVETEDAEIGIQMLDEHGAPLRHKTGPNAGRIRYEFEQISRTVLGSRGGGLEKALEKGYLEGRGPKPWTLYQAGMEYKKAWEIYEAELSRAGEGAAGGFGPKGPQLRIVEAGETLAIMRAGLSKLEVDVLDMVCGRDQRLRQAATTLGKGFPATQRALRNGLHIALDNWTAAKKDGVAGRAAEHVRTVDLMVRRIRP